MKQTLSHYQATELIHEVYDNQFSWKAADCLADYYESLEEEIGEEMEIDPVAIACDWREFNSDEELIEAFDYLLPDAEGETEEECEDWEPEDKLDAIKDYLMQDTDLIEFDGGYLVRAF